MEVGQDGDGGSARHAMRDDPGRQTRFAERVKDRLGQDLLAIHAEAEAGYGDAKLRGGDVAVLALGVVEDGLHRAREAVAGRGTTIDGGARRADDGEFGRDEETVQQHERGNDQEFGHGFLCLNSSGTPPSSSVRTSSSVINPATRPSLPVTSAWCERRSR